jgi:GNAT superfamily N-acetyltransferase
MRNPLPGEHALNRVMGRRGEFVGVTKRYIYYMITIRKAIPEDAAAIIDFQQKMAMETEQLILDPKLVTPGVKEVFANSARGEYWVAEVDGIVIASLLITFEWSDWRNANVWWFQSVYVLPSFRRKGIFRSMYLYIKDEAEKQNVAGLRLYVETNNTAAQKTYESLGMRSEHYRMYEWLRE